MAGLILKSANIIYIPDHDLEKDYNLVIHALKCKGLPVPRFFVERRFARSKLINYAIRLAGGFIVDRSKFNNYIYKEVLCQYMSTMIEYGMPLLYFPEKFSEVDPHGIKNNFVKVIIDTMVNHTLEIVIVPISIGKINIKGKGLYKEKNSIEVKLKNPIFLSEYTKTPELLQEVYDVFNTLSN